MKNKIFENIIERRPGFRKWIVEGIIIICEVCDRKVIWRISDCYGTIYPNKEFLRILFAGGFKIENKSYYKN